MLGVVGPRGSVSSVQYEAPGDGDTIIMVSPNTVLVVDPSAAIAALEVVLPIGITQQTAVIVTRQRIDALTVSSPVDQAVDWAVNELPANGAIGLLYIEQIATWVIA